MGAHPTLLQTFLHRVGTPRLAAKQDVTNADVLGRTLPSAGGLPKFGSSRKWRIRLVTYAGIVLYDIADPSLR